MAIVSALSLAGSTGHAEPQPAPSGSRPSAPVEDVQMKPLTGKPGLALFDAAWEQINSAYYSKKRLIDTMPVYRAYRAKVEAGRLDAYRAIDTYVRNLDPHSSFRPVIHVTEMFETTGFDALGFAPSRGEPYSISRVFFNSAASDKNLQVGDIITSINGQPFSKDNADTISGSVCDGTSNLVTVDFRRGGQPVQVTLACEYENRHSVSAGVLEGDVGYVRVTQYSKDAAFDVEQAISDMRGSKPAGYILDLRDNPGGFVEEARLILDLFIDSKAQMFAEMGSNGRLHKPVRATPGDILHGKPLVVLINHESWSAAELTALVLQSQGRATVVGTRSAGKGSVQTVGFVSVSGKSVAQLNLTTDLYALPNGISPQLRGVMPDVITSGDAYTLSRESQLPNPLPNPTGTAFTPAELARVRQCDQAATLADAKSYPANENGGHDMTLMCGIRTLREKMAANPRTSRGVVPDQASAGLPKPR